MYGLPTAHHYRKKPVICFNIFPITQISQAVMFCLSTPQDCNLCPHQTFQMTHLHPNLWIPILPLLLNTPWPTKEQFLKDLNPDLSNLHLLLPPLEH